MEKSGNLFDKQMESPRSPTRLQRQAPTALQLDHSAHNQFSPSSAIEGTAIPLLSPLYVPPRLSSSLREGEEFRFHVGGNGCPDPKGSHLGEWQHPAMSDHSEQMALLTMFQTKFVLVNDSR
ncbi:PREDICTED: uncharacterized protein LOC104826309 [Tarenaya hassleriana]|uniref:uncharacterized protein LOC104826309 n=1 Tax=Tarenaya hassleriana TaxID=28532 RepID=UPI00053C9DCF|nr:PREDICTED: uncharacterized protein LOC104826309 [Tarenaya hassleriana]